MFSFSLSGELTTMCDRCLGDLIVPVEGEEQTIVCYFTLSTSVCH